jgi:hypothetical protein
MAVAYCIACGQVHVGEESKVVVYDKDGYGWVTYHKDCGEKAKELTEEGLIARGYTLNGIAGKIVEGIKEGYGPKAPIVEKKGRK